MADRPAETSTEFCCRELLEAAVRMNSEPPVQINLEIALLMEKLALIFGFDAVLFSKLSEDGAGMVTVHASPSGDFPGLPAAGSAIRLPYMLKKIRHGVPLVLSSLPGELPADAPEDRMFFENTRIHSAIMLPSKSSSSVYVLSAFCFQETDSWPDDVVECLQQAADFFTSAFARMATAAALGELGPVEALLNEISSAYINLPPREIGHVVDQDLGRLARLIGADRYVICLAGDIKRRPQEFIFSFDYWANELKEQVEEEYAWLVAHGGHFNFRYIIDRCLEGQIVAFSDIGELPDAEPGLKQVLEKLHVKSQLAVPISANREIIGFMIVHTTRKHRRWPDELVRKIRQFGDLFANAYVRKRSEAARLEAREEIERLKARLESDYRYLSDEFKKTVGGEMIVGASRAMNRVMEQVMQVAPTQTPVLLLGETGAGKGVLALALHQTSRRADRPLVQLNCATLASGVIESELFGHERGAFTGADRQRAGRFEIAEGSTLFLDEIGELPLELQAKLLRVLETGEFERLGGSNTLKTDARIIAATNRDLEKEVAAGRFRKDLWYRLSIFPIRIPPLRERTEDIPAIVEGFIEQFSKNSGRRFATLSEGVMNALQQHSWPGNVRELRNLIERAVIVSPGAELCITVPNYSSDSECPAFPGPIVPFAEMERMYLLHALEKAGWRIEGAGGAADLLGFNPSTLRSRMRKQNIRKHTSRPEQFKPPHAENRLSKGLR
jgi:transcriptional regulator with GAF, ATPase, and Fis domain